MARMNPIGIGQHWLFGHGSDGNVTISSTVNPDRQEYNYETLTITSTGALAQRAWFTQGFDRLILRCRSALVLDGSITANDIASSALANYGAKNGGGLTGGPPWGLPPYFGHVASSTLVQADDILPVPGGHGKTASQAYDRSQYYDSATMKIHMPLTYPGMTTAGKQNGSDNILAGYDLADFVDALGLRRFSIAAGCGGGSDASATPGSVFGGSGGGAIIILAPVIHFGASSSIEANGGNGADGSGGGGGGSIQIYTEREVSATDRARCTAAGGAASTGDSGHGADGVVTFHTIAGR